MTTRNNIFFVISAVLLTGSTSVAMADNLSEVAGARANARAGGPTNAQDAELLRRYSGLDESSRGYSGRNYSGYRAGTIENRRYSRRYNRYDRTGSYNE